MPLSWLFSPLPQTWLNFWDTHLQNCWFVCIILNSKNTLASSSFVWDIRTQYWGISCIEISLWPIFRTEINKLNRKHGYFKRQNNQTFIFPRISIRQYTLVARWLNIIINIRELYPRLMKLILCIPIIQKLYFNYKKSNLGMNLQFSASLSDIWPTTPSSKTHNYIIHLPFVTIRYSVIILM